MPMARTEFDRIRQDGIVNAYLVPLGTDAILASLVDAPCVP